MLGWLTCCPISSCSKSWCFCRHIFFCQGGYKNTAFILTFLKSRNWMFWKSYSDQRRKSQSQWAGRVRDGWEGRLGCLRKNGVYVMQVFNSKSRSTCKRYYYLAPTQWKQALPSLCLLPYLFFFSYFTIKYVFCEFVKWHIWDISAGCVCHDSAVDIRKSTALKLSACWSALSRNPFSGYTVACQTSFHIAVGFVV